MPAPSRARDATEIGQAELGTLSEEETAAAAEMGLLAAGTAPAGESAVSRSRRWLRVAMAVCALAGAAVAILSASSTPHRHLPTWHAGDMISKSGLGLLTTLSHQLGTGGGPAKEMETFMKLEEELKAVKALFNTSQGSLSQGTGPLRELLLNGTWKKWMQDGSNQEKMRVLLSEGSDLHDGNVCPSDEEAHAGLCYKKCSLLIGGRAIRTSAFSCCKESPCTLFNQKVKFRICGGFDVAGDSQGGGCPHNNGACYVDEELNADRCYKKCSLLTDGEYMFRSAAETCCKYNPHESLLACLDPEHIKTSRAFAAGGGELEPGSAKKGTKWSHYPRRDAAEADLESV